MNVITQLSAWFIYSLFFFSNAKVRNYALNRIVRYKKVQFQTFFICWRDLDEKFQKKLIHPSHFLGKIEYKRVFKTRIQGLSNDIRIIPTGCVVQEIYVPLFWYIGQFDIYGFQHCAHIPDSPAMELIIFSGTCCAIPNEFRIRCIFSRSCVVT